MRYPARTRDRKGSGFIETVVGAIFLIPICFCLLDLMVLVIANSINDSAVKNAARAAASQSSGVDAASAAAQSLAAIKPSMLVKSIVLEDFTYDDAGHTTTSVRTRMVVKLPIPFPGLDELTFKAQDVEPIVGIQHP